MDVQINCPCPPKADGTARHDHDTVTLPETLDFRTTLIVRQSIAYSRGPDVTLAELVATMIEIYVLHCISEWTIVDDKNRPVPVAKATVREYLLSHYADAEKVGEAADDLYTEKVVLPLLAGASSSSPSTPTPEPPASPRPTSATTNGSTPRKPSKRSSTTTSQMAVTGPMAASPGGVSNSSLS